MEHLIFLWWLQFNACYAMQRGKCYLKPQLKVEISVFSMEKIGVGIGLIHTTEGLNPLTCRNRWRREKGDTNVEMACVV